MSKFFYFGLLFCFVVNNADGQPGSGKRWYLFSRNRILELTITGDSMINRQLSWNLEPNVNARHYREASPLDSMIRIGESYCMVNHIYSDNHLTKIISILKPSKRHPGLFSFRSDSIRTADMRNIYDIVLADTTEGIFPLFIPEAELTRIRKLPGIDTINAVDFKRYVDCSLLIRERSDSQEPQNVSLNEQLYYGYFMLRYCFAEIGYNPLFTDVQFEAMIKKFQGQPETEKLVNQLLQ